MYDISADALLDVAPIHLKNAAGEHAFAGPGLPCRIHLFGPGTEQFAIVENRQSARAIKRAQENDNKVTMAAPADRANELAEDLADLTSHFENFAYKGQTTGRDVFKAFYLDRAMVHYQRQITKAVGDTGNWRPGAAGQSPTS